MDILSASGVGRSNHLDLHYCSELDLPTTGTSRWSSGLRSAPWVWLCWRLSTLYLDRRMSSPLWNFHNWRRRLTLPVQKWTASRLPTGSSCQPQL